MGYVIGGLLLLAAVLFVFGYRLFCALLVRQQQPAAGEPQPAFDALKEFIAENAAARDTIARTLPCEPVSIRSEDGLQLCGTLLPAAQQTDRVVLCVHGYKSTGMGDFGSLGLMLHEKGYHVLIVDDRAHGDSEGRFIGLGALDRRDAACWCRYLVGRFGEGCEILLFGVSMGAATVLFASAEEDLPRQVKGAVSDCAFSNIEECAGKLVGMDAGGWLLRLMVSVVDVFVRLRAGYSLRDPLPRDAVKKARVPILFIHGGADDFVPTRMVFELADACPTAHEVYVAPGAWHACSYISDKAAYEAQLDRFTAKLGF